MIRFGGHICNVAKPLTSEAINDFCNAINLSDADVYIIMTQKAARLFEILIEHGMIDSHILKKEIYFDSVISFDHELFLNKQIIILDDILISGSSIAITINKLIKYGVNKDSVIGIYVLGIDTLYQRMKFVNSRGENILWYAKALPDAECIEISYDITNLFNYYGKMLDTDYPVYEQISVPYNTLVSNYSFLGDFIDISNSSLNTSLKMNVFFPSENFLRILWKKIGINLNEVLDLKFRIFSYNYNDNSQHTYIIPLSCLKEISKENLEIIFAALFSTNITKNKDVIAWDLVSKAKYLQFYISYIAISCFFGLVGNNCTYSFQRNNVEKLFGKTHAELLFEEFNLTKHVNNINTLNYHKIIPTTFDFLSIDENIFTDNESETNFNINSCLFLPFSYYFIKYELPARKQLKNSNLHYINDIKKIQKLSKRLNEGFSLKALYQIYENIGIPQKIISLFIDRAIDKGFIVPITYYNKKTNTICRAYRHGEDLPFGPSDKYRLLYYLQCMGENLEQENCNEMATITFQKSIVLFYQIGLRDGQIFNRFLGFNNLTLIKERFSVHGAVRTSPKKLKCEHIYEERENSTWVTKWLKTNNFIREKSETDDEDKDLYIVESKNISDFLSTDKLNIISKNALEKIELISNIISTLYIANINHKDHYKHDLISLTSCATPILLSSAVATALHYFSRYQSTQVQAGLQSIDNDCNPQFDYNDIVQTLHSVRNKYKWYNENRATQFINKAQQILRDNGEQESDRYWSRIWISEKNDNPSLNQNTNYKINQGMCLLFFFSSYYEWLTRFYKKASLLDSFLNYPDVSSDYYNQYQACLRSINKSDNLFNIFETVNSKLNWNERFYDLKSFVDKVISNSDECPLHFCSESIVDKIEDDISQLSNTYTIRYESVLIFEYRPIKNVNYDFLMMDFWELIDDDIKVYTNIIKFQETCDGFSRYGVFFDTSSNQDLDLNRTFLKFYDFLKSIFANRVYCIRTIVIPNIPPRVIFKHNLQSNIEKYSTEFDSLFVSDLDNIWNESQIIQILLVQSKYTSIDLEESLIACGAIKCEEITELGICNSFSIKINRFTEKTVESVESIHTNSTVKILRDNKVIATGFLLRYDGKVFCISCQHIDKGETELFAKLMYGEFCFRIKKINKSPINTSNGIAIKAIDEVAIFEPRFFDKESEYQWIDNSRVFSEDNFKSMNESNELKCYGYHRPDRDKSGKWEIIESISGEIDGEYYELDSKNQLSPGFSGAAVINNNQNIYAMHVAHEKLKMTVIPIKIIASAIEDYLKEEK